MNSAKDLLKQISELVNNMKDKKKSKEKILMVNNFRLGRFYILSEIHKRLQSISGRPVISILFRYLTEKDFVIFGLSFAVLSKER